MGEIADMILDGILDEQTGEFIDNEISHSGGCGYPRTIQQGNYNSIKGSSKNASKELNGIYKYMRQFPEIKGKASQVHKYMNKYSKTIGFQGTIKQQAKNIQEDFPSFVKYIKQQRKFKDF